MSKIPECIPTLQRVLEKASADNGTIRDATDDAYALRRIAMTLHRWHEMECGIDHGCIERDGENADGRPYWLSSMTGRRFPIADREKGAHKRLAKIMQRYPTLQAYIQGDPRGASLYILRPGDVPKDADVHGYYSRGIAVYK